MTGRQGYQTGTTGPAVTAASPRRRPPVDAYAGDPAQKPGGIAAIPRKIKKMY